MPGAVFFFFCRRARRSCAFSSCEDGNPTNKGFFSSPARAFRPQGATEVCVRAAGAAIRHCTCVGMGVRMWRDVRVAMRAFCAAVPASALPPRVLLASLPHRCTLPHTALVSRRVGMGACKARPMCWRHVDGVDGAGWRECAASRTAGPLFPAPYRWPRAAGRWCTVGSAARHRVGVSSNISRPCGGTCRSHPTSGTVLRSLPS